jgi:fluoride exporter
MAWIWVALGSAVGGMLRYWCSGVVARRVGEAFPWGTLVVNVIGSWVIGLFAALTAGTGPLAAESATRQLIIVGLCGGYTTFSSFSLQTLNLGREGEWGRAISNSLASVILCFIAVAIGWLTGEVLG